MNSKVTPEADMGQGESDEREIVLTRLLDAPRELVYEAWTNPEHLPRWWGPRGFTATTQEIDVRVGGQWRFILSGPDGTDYPNVIEYRELVRPERIVYAHGADEPDMFDVTVTFTEEDGKTRVTSRMVFPTKEERAATAAFGAVELGNQTLERLAEHLATM
jgi:uncharacterized protein YndB with AHSA1/START domain